MWSSGMILALGKCSRLREVPSSILGLPLMIFSPFFNTLCVLHGLVIVVAKFQLDQMTTGNVTAFFRIHGFRGLSRCMTTPVATTAQDTEPASR